MPVVVSLILMMLSFGPLFAQPDRFGMHRLDSQFVGEDGPFLMDKTAASGVRWIIVRAHWSFIEPNGPAGTPFAVPGYRSGVHTYNWSAIDLAVRDARARGLSVILQLTKGPDWATGAPDGCGRDLGEANADCGLIANSRKDLFVAAWEDFCYNAAIRYSQQVDWYILWNEPNLRPSFNPEAPYDDIVSEYARLILRPGRTAVKAARSTAGIAGPELTTLNTYWGDWLSNGLEPLLRSHGDQFDAVTVHSYNSLAFFTIFHMNRIRDLLSQLGLTGQKPVWLTEFNFRNGSCNTSDEQIALQLGLVYLGMDASWWARSFYFSLQDAANQSCGFGLLHSKEYAGGAYLDKPIYRLFKNLLSLRSFDRRRP